MTATQINAEIYKNLSYLADSEDYMNKVLSYLKKLSLQKSQNSKKQDEKIRVDLSRPLPSDKYVGLASPNREDDEKALEEYMRKKYGMYL